MSFNIESEEVKGFLAYIGKGVDFETAAHASGLSIGQLQIWLERGKVEDDRIAGTQKPAKKAEAQFVALWRSVKRQRHAALADLQVAYHHAAKDDWRAADTLLSKIMPERYAKPSEKKALLEMEGVVFNGNNANPATHAIDGSTGEL